MAGAIANEKWDRTYFDELQQVSGQCHYEQEGVLEGNLSLGSQTLPFRLPCVRDHSFGKRDWNYMNNHLWLMAVSPQCQFNYSLLTKDGLLPEADLIYFLTHGEIGRLIQGESSLAPLAARRKKAFALQEELSFDDTYMGKPVADVYDLAQYDGALSGIPVSNGQCEGRVRIVHSAEDANRHQKGEIMVARFTDIGWTPYYSVVSGLITEIGSSLSHGAVVAREYGLPTIVNVKGATQVLKDGDHILMDAEKGLITRVL